MVTSFARNRGPNAIGGLNNISSNERIGAQGVGLPEEKRRTRLKRRTAINRSSACAEICFAFLPWEMRFLRFPIQILNEEKVAWIDRRHYGWHPPAEVSGSLSFLQLFSKT